MVCTHSDHTYRRSVRVWKVAVRLARVMPAQGTSHSFSLGRPSSRTSAFVLTDRVDLAFPIVTKFVEGFKA